MYDKMYETDAKVRLFLELSHPHQIQILSYTPLCSYEKWNPKKMYNKPNSQYYYAFINDKEVISKVKTLLNPDVHVLEEIENVKEEIELPIEFNGYNIEEFQESENLSKSNINTSNNPNSENNDDNKLINVDEEKYVVFCRFSLKNFGFIHDYSKIQKKDINAILRTPIIYALKGRIKTLINLRIKELESKRGEGEPINLHTNLIHAEEDKSNLNDKQTLGKKKEIDEKNDFLKENIGIDGHWFLVNEFDNVEFLSLIKYKEIFPSTDNQDKSNDDHSNVSNLPPHYSSKILSVNSNNINSNNLNNINTQTRKDKFSQPQKFSYYLKESKKYVSVYQNKSCNLHHNKNEFICKKCETFCCLECFESSTKDNIHYGHKVILLDEAMNKFEEDSRFLDERIQYLKTIIENEIMERKNEIANIKNKNSTIVNQINEENEKIKAEIIKEEINRAKVTGFLGNEVLRIINDYNLKCKYLIFLYEKGDMNTYLINYFIFEKNYNREIKKNLDILERKIILTANKFKTNNSKLSGIIEDLKKNL